MNLSHIYVLFTLGRAHVTCLGRWQHVKIIGIPLAPVLSYAGMHQEEWDSGTLLSTPCINSKRSFGKVTTHGQNIFTITTADHPAGPSDLQIKT